MSKVDFDETTVLATCPACKKLVEVSEWEVCVDQLVGVICSHCGHVFRSGEETYFQLRKKEA